MNKIFIVGNLTRDPDLRSVNASNGPISVCEFTVAVNRRTRGNDGQNEADFFRVTAWRQLGENCKKFLAKGRKVAVTGSVSASAYMGNDGSPRASMDIQADDVEFLTPRQDGQQGGASGYQNAQSGYQNAQPTYQNAQPAYQNTQQPRVDAQSGFVQVDDDDLPF